MAEKKKRFGWKTFGGRFLIISIAAHLLFGMVATYMVVQTIQAKRKLTFKAGPPSPNPNQRAIEHKVSMAKKQSTMSAPVQAKRITTTGISKVALPAMPTMPGVNAAAPGKMAGTGGAGVGVDSAVGMGGGIGGSGGVFTLPKLMADRCSPAARAKAMRENGGKPECETAIGNALRWLKQHQNPDGSWGEGYKVAMTGLSLLSFMGHCERPGHGEFGECVTKAVNYLVQAGAAANGKALAGNPYQHAIASYALGEAYILTKDEKIVPVLKDTVSVIVNGQREDGGWAYGYAKAPPSKKDTSVAGWQIQALKAAHLSGLEIAGVDKAMENAMKFIKSMQGKNGGFGYNDAGDKWSLTGVGVLCLQIGTGEKGGPVHKGLEYMFSKLPGVPQDIDYKAKDANLYAWYYNTQACFQAGGSAWGKWNHRFQSELLKNQLPDGSWPETTVGTGQPNLTANGTGTGIDAQVYRTTLCTLMLEVFYRYLATARAT